MFMRRGSCRTLGVLGALGASARTHRRPYQNHTGTGIGSAFATSENRQSGSATTSSIAPPARPPCARRASSRCGMRAPVVIMSVLHERRASSAVLTSSTSTAAQAFLVACPTFQRMVVVDGGTQRAKCGGAPESDARILARLRLIWGWDSGSRVIHPTLVPFRSDYLPAPHPAQHGRSDCAGPSGVADSVPHDDRMPRTGPAHPVLVIPEVPLPPRRSGCATGESPGKADISCVHSSLVACLTRSISSSATIPRAPLTCCARRNAASAWPRCWQAASVTGPITRR